MTDILEWEKGGQTFVGTPQQLVDEMTYSSYRHARQSSPASSVEGWACIYGGAVARLEARYQQEQAKANV